MAYCPNDGGTAGGQCMQVRPRLRDETKEVVHHVRSWRVG